MTPVVEAEKGLSPHLLARCMLTSAYVEMLSARGWSVAGVRLGPRTYHEVILSGSAPWPNLIVSQEYGRQRRRALAVSPCVVEEGISLVSSYTREIGIRSGLVSRWRAGISEQALDLENEEIGRLVTATRVHVRLLRSSMPGEEPRRRVALRIASAICPELLENEQELVAAQIFNSRDWSWVRGDAYSLLHNSVKNLQDGGIARHANLLQPMRHVTDAPRRTEISRLCWRAFEIDFG